MLFLACSVIFILKLIFLSSHSVADDFVNNRHMYVADIMGWKKFLFTVSVFLVIPAYFLYTPIPDGYSATSACKMQLTLAILKTVDALVCACTLALTVHIAMKQMTIFKLGSKLLIASAGIVQGTPM